MNECGEIGSAEDAFFPAMPENARFPRGVLDMIWFSVELEGGGVGNNFVSHLKQNMGAASPWDAISWRQYYLIYT
jgi:hypothetical protein